MIDIIVHTFEAIKQRQARLISHLCTDIISKQSLISVRSRVEIWRTSQLNLANELGIRPPVAEVHHDVGQLRKLKALTGCGLLDRPSRWRMSTSSPPSDQLHLGILGKARLLLKKKGGTLTLKLV